MNPSESLTLAFILIPLSCGVLAFLCQSLDQYLQIKQFNTNSVQAANVRERAASIFSEQLLTQRLNSNMVYEALEPESLTKHAIRTLRPQLDSITDDIMSEHYRTFWENLPVFMKNRVYANNHQQLPRIVDQILEDIGDYLDQILDLRTLIVQHLSTDNRLTELLRTSLGIAPKLMVFYTTILAILLGIPLTLLSIASVPLLFIGSSLFCLLILARAGAKYCVYGNKAIKLGLWAFKPYLLARQAMWANRLAESLSHGTLSFSQLINAVMHGPRPKLIESVFKRRLQNIADSFSLRAVTQLMIGPTAYADIKHSLLEHVMDLHQPSLRDHHFYQTRTEILMKLLHETLLNAPASSLPKVSKRIFLPFSYYYIAFAAGSSAACTWALSYAPI